MVAIRVAKIVLVFFVGIQAWLFVVGNVANWSAGVRAVGGVMTMQGGVNHSVNIFPVVNSPLLHAIGFLLILAGEFLVGAFALKGALDLWAARKESASIFDASKTNAILGCALALLVWFGGFIVIGGAWFHMWQTESGHRALEASFVFAVTAGLVLLFVDRPEEDRAVD